ncbi:MULTISPECIES: OmpA family protein [Pseudomonas]|uniref:OmpA family protein n=1 Tax=Pseudomonas nitroreducens TaxID=46680 RepID=UPI001E28F8C4|nr:MULTISPECIES: OmpA family protein [Pseudomonas]MCE4073590.1 OmpA family protein [Pseudomonas nitritireducens]MCE4082779.1 OmpA family protein [Pseudomonas nitroreducens]
MEYPIYKAMHRAARVSVLCAAISCSVSVLASPNESIFGAAYQPVDAVVAEQSQVVFFRGADQGTQGANVYVDRELQGALMPGGFTVFCVPAGEHSLEAYIGDEPLYEGKLNPRTSAVFEGGKSYFLEVAANPKSSTPVVLNRQNAEQQLQGLRLQRHVINRASSVVPCETETRLSLRSDVLFNFGKSGYSDITDVGHAELRKIAEAIKSQHVESVEVGGHADPIGSVQSNQRLSEARAQTVKSVLLQLGVGTEAIRAVGYGSSEPVVQCDSGSRNDKIACNAPNRRVDLLIRGKRSDT